MNIPDHIIKEFKGLKTIIKDPKSLEPGTPQDALNWLTGWDPEKKSGDHIELRSGIQRLGKTLVQGSGKITGLGVGVRSDGSEIPFFSYGQKIKYYDVSQDDTVEVGSNLLPIAANGEDVAFAPYSNLAGYWMYVSSPNSSIYKIPTANPASAVDQQSFDYKGFIKIKQNRMFLWNRLNSNNGTKDATGLYLSYVDVGKGITQVNNETIGTGDGSTKAFSGTLSQRTSNRTVDDVQVVGMLSSVAVTAITQASNAQITANGHGLAVGNNVVVQGVAGMTQINGLVLYVNAVIDANNFTVVRDTTSFTAYSSGGTVGKAEYFVDNKGGILTSNLGGTGTINYATGAVAVNFNTAPVNTTAVVSNYFYEDSKNQGVCNLIATTVAGQGKNFLQSDDGNFMNLFSIGGDEYCFHATKTWILTLGTDDTKATNLIYRDKVGIPYWRAADETGDGIPYLDYTDKSNPVVRQLQYNDFSTAIIPVPLSEVLDLTSQGFDFPVVKCWGNYIVLACQGLTNGVNNPGNDTLYLQNRRSGYWDKLGIGASCLEEYNGQLIAGDPFSNNVYKILTGNDDDGSNIFNYWKSGLDNLGVDCLKRFYVFIIDGFINPTQQFDILLAYDNGSYTKVFTVKGSDNYVDLGLGTVVGAQTVGAQVVGGGAVPNAYHFRKEILVSSDVFEFVSAMFQATGIGALQINEYGFKKIMYKGRRTIPAYDSAI